MKLYPEGFQISELLQRIDTGKIALPEFQRDALPPPAAVEVANTPTST